MSALSFAEYIADAAAARPLLDPADSPRRETPPPTEADLWRTWARHMRDRGFASRIPAAQEAER